MGTKPSKMGRWLLSGLRNHSLSKRCRGCEVGGGSCGGAWSRAPEFSLKGVGGDGPAGQYL